MGQLTLSVLLFWSQASLSYGFVPGHNLITQIGTAGYGHYHTELTLNAVKEVLRQYLMNDDGKHSSETVDELLQQYFDVENESRERFRLTISELQTSVAQVDDNEKTKDNPAFHFDAERFADAQDKITQRRALAIQLIRSQDYQEAKNTLGQALHTLQDFYSHSNWIEMGNKEPHPDLGLGKPLGNVAKPDQYTCRDCSSSLNNWAGGYCQDNILPEILEKRLLTSGYYSGQTDDDGKTVPKPEGKCSHGGVLDSTRWEVPRGGICKDTDVYLYAPHAYLHEDAATMATAASTLFLKGIMNQVGRDQFGLFLDLLDKFTLAVVGRFYNRPNVADAAVSVLQQSRNASIPPIKFIIVGITCASRDDVVQSYESLGDAVVGVKGFVSNSDCPPELNPGTDPNESSLRITASSVLSAADRSSSKGSLYVLGSPSDLQDSDTGSTTLKQQIREKALAVHYLAVDRPSTSVVKRWAINGGHRLAHTASGGAHFYESVADMEHAHELHAIREEATVTLANLELPDGNHWAEFYVDRSIQSLYVNLTLRNVHGAATVVPQLSLLSPSGKQPRHATVLLHSSHTKLLKLVKPENGLWTVAVKTRSGTKSGSTTLVVKARSDLRVQFSLHKFTNGSGTRIPTSMPKQPLVGDNLTLSVAVFNARNCRTQNLKLLGADGHPLVVKPLTVDRKNRYRFLVDFVVPDRPLLVAVSGSCGKRPFQRAAPEIITPQSFVTRVRLPTSDHFLQLAPGSSHVIRFIVTNIGLLAKHFKFRIEDQFHFAKSLTVLHNQNRIRNTTERVQENTTMLLQNESAEVDVEILVPLIAQLGQVSVIKLTVTSVDDNEWQQSAATKVPVMVRNPNRSQKQQHRGPRCRVLASTIDDMCSNVKERERCGTVGWNAQVELESGDAKLDHISVDQIPDRAGALTSSKTIKNKTSSGKPVTILKVSGTCCVRSVTVVAHDLLGLTNSCELTHQNTAPAITANQSKTGTDRYRITVGLCIGIVASTVASLIGLHIVCTRRR